MGGKVFVMGGDFRQVLPVVRRGSPAQVVAVSLCRSPLWDNTRVLRLTANMRAAEDQGWSNWLLSIGEGRERPFPQTDCIRLPHSMVAPTRDVSDLLTQSMVTSPSPAPLLILWTVPFSRPAMTRWTTSTTWSPAASQDK